MSWRRITKDCVTEVLKNSSYPPKALLQNLLVQQILNSHQQRSVLFKTFASLKCCPISAVLLSNVGPAENILGYCFLLLPLRKLQNAEMK